MATYDNPFDALGDPTRRRIFELLRNGPLAVGELAGELPVSRPAVSQHLRVLKQAGLVTERRNGTRRLYRLDPGGLDGLRSYFDSFWDSALADFKAAAERKGGGMATQTELTVRKTVTVAAPLERAFEVFTERISTWWPLATHSLGGDDAEDAVIEPRAGGRMYELQRGGTEGRWATVVAWEPPHRLVLEWTVNPDSPPTEVEVRFTPEGEGTVVELEHRGWERYGETAETSRTGYDAGWEVILERYRTVATA